MPFSDLLLIGFLATKNINSFEINKEVFWQAGKIGPDNSVIPMAGFSLIAAIGTALVGSLFAADAWYNVTYLSDEVINPKRNVPLSLFFGTLLDFSNLSAYQFCLYKNSASLRLS